MTFRGADGQDWSPENYYKRFYGTQPLRRGLELSINGMTVRLAQSVGMRKIIDMSKRLGVTRDMAPVLAMALGAGETTPFNLTAAYTAFPNGGRKVDAHLIELVEDREGKTIFKTDGRECDRCNAGFSGDESPRIPPRGTQVMDPITAYQITSMLEGVVIRGTGTGARMPGRAIAGKTGTTNEYRSAWFMGFTPQVVVGVFVGFDDNRGLGEGETGATAAVPIFAQFMQTAAKGLPPTPFAAPKNAVFSSVNGVMEAFRPGSIPRYEPTMPVGPQPYLPTAPIGPAGPQAPAAPRSPAEAPPDLSGLF
jgi:penicillin-binding protein 1A